MVTDTGSRVASGGGWRPSSRWWPMLAVCTAVAAAAPPTGVTANALDARVDVAWQPAAGATAYNVYRGTAAGSITTRVSPAGGDHRHVLPRHDGGQRHDLLLRRPRRHRRRRVGQLAGRAGRRRGDLVHGRQRRRRRELPPRPQQLDAPQRQRRHRGLRDRAEHRQRRVGRPEGQLDRVDDDGRRDLPHGLLRRRGRAPPLDAQVDPRRAAARLQPQHDARPRRLLELVGDRDPHDARARGRPASTCCASSAPTTPTTTSSSSPSATTAASPTCCTAARSRPSRPTTAGAAGRSTTGTPAAATPSATRRARSRCPSTGPTTRPSTGQRDWYTVDEIATVYWLEQSGYDVSYASDADLEFRPVADPATRAPTSRRATTSTGRPACGRRPPRAATPASTCSSRAPTRSTGRSASRARPRASPAACRSVTRRTQSGGPDPSGIPTGTWRDPAGANDPENALTGVMYVGDNDFGYFPLRVSAAQGADRIWRYTGLDALAPNTSVNIGQTLVGWEWDSRVANGREPAGVKTLAASPVTGNLIQGNGAVPDARLGDGDGDQVHGAERRAGPHRRHQPVEPRAGAERAQRGRARHPHPAGDDQHPRRHGRAARDAGLRHHRRRRLERHPGPDRRQRDDAGQRLAPRRLERRRRRQRLQRLPHRRAARRRAAARRPRELRARSPARASPTPACSSGTTYYYVVTAVVSGVQTAVSNEVSGTTSTSAADPTRINVGRPGLHGALRHDLARRHVLHRRQHYSITQTITGTADPALYQDERWGQFSYAIPVANGTYDVRFHFAELYYGTAVSGSCVGKRIFGMNIVDTPGTDLTNIDVCAAVGARAALRPHDQQRLGHGRHPQHRVGLRERRRPGGRRPSRSSRPRRRRPRRRRSRRPRPPTARPAVASSTRPTATFSRAMDPTTITTSSLQPGHLRRRADRRRERRLRRHDPRGDPDARPPPGGRDDLRRDADHGDPRGGRHRAGRAGHVELHHVRAAAAGHHAADGRDQRAGRRRDGLGRAWPSTRPPATTAASRACSSCSTAIRSARRTRRRPTASAWDTLAANNGSHTLSAVARDAAGNTTTSAPVTVTVFNAPPDTTPPTASVTAPQAGATVAGTVTLQATANDDTGVVGVTFAIDGVVTGAEDTTAPYSLSWNSAAVRQRPAQRDRDRPRRGRQQRGLGRPWRSPSTTTSPRRPSPSRRRPPGRRSPARRR